MSISKLFIYYDKFIYSRLYFKNQYPLDSNRSYYDF